MTKTIVQQLSSDGNETPFSRYIDSLRAQGSKRTMITILNKIADYLSDHEFDAEDFAWHAMDKDDVGAAKDWMTEQYAPATVNKGLCALRGVVAMAWRMGLMGTTEQKLIFSNLPNVENHPAEPTGRLIKDTEIERLLDVCKADDSAAGIRDRAMLALLYATGARRSELVHLDVADFDAANNSLTLRETKGWKDRTVFIGHDVAAILDEWLALLSGPGPLFRRILKGDSLADSRITDQGLYFVLAGRAAKAKVGNLTPHDFRYTFISNMINRGVDLATVSKIVGHVDVKQTVAYDRRGIEPMRGALMALPK